VLDQDIIKLKDDNLAQGMTMIQASELLVHQGEDDNAVASFNRAMEFLRSWPMKLGDVYLELGHLCMKQSRYQEGDTNFKHAKNKYIQALEDKRLIEEDIFPQQKITYYLQNRMCCVLSHLGSIAFSQHDFKSAEDYFHQALDESKKSAVAALYIDRNLPIQDTSVVKEARLNVAECFNNLASLCAEQNNRNAAIKHYNDALALQIQQLGEDNDSVAKTLYNIGTLHYRSQEYNLALKSYKQVLKMRRLLFGPRHISNAEILIEIATAHEKNEEIDMALSALKAADTILSLQYGPKHFSRGRIAFRVGAMHARRGDEELALASLNRKYCPIYICIYLCQNMFISYFIKISGAIGIYKDLGMEDSHFVMNSVRDAIRYIKGEGKNSIISAPEYIKSLSDDKSNSLWTPVKAILCDSSDFLDKRDDNDNDTDRHDPNLDLVYS
jgi:tetratricopeptide (TPR) repeat protein